MSMFNIPLMKKEQTWIGNRGKTRQIPMKVICPALSRTGTSSMRVALWELGYEAYHGWALFENPPDSILWQEAMKAKFEGKGRVYTKQDFDAILHDSEWVVRSSRLRRQIDSYEVPSRTYQAVSFQKS
jgi:Sulfotransferase domain